MCICFGKNEKRVTMIIYVNDIILASENLKKLNEIKYMLKAEFDRLRTNKRNFRYKN